MHVETRFLPQRVEVVVTDLDREPFRNQDVSLRQHIYCTCTWQPIQVRFVWEMTDDGWRLLDRILYCCSVTEDGAFGRQKSFDFSPEPRRIPDIRMPAWIRELEAEHYPTSLMDEGKTP